MKAVGCEVRSHHDGFGTLADDDDTLVDADTLFAIGSLSKSFTTIALLSAIADHPSVTLDTPVQDILPEFAFPPAEAQHLIIPRTLLEHTSTLPVHDPVSVPDPAHERTRRLPTDDKTKSQPVTRLGRVAGARATSEDRRVRRDRYGGV